MTSRLSSAILAVLVGVVVAGCSGGSVSTELPAPATSTGSSTSSSTAPVVDAPGGMELLGSEDFDDGVSELFWTGSDELLSSVVVDDALEVHVVDVSQTQTLRSTWPPLSAVTIESDIAVSGHSLGFFTMGCWSGGDSYEVAWTGDRGLFVIGRAEAGPDSSAGPTVLSDLGSSSLVPSVGDSFRLRVSCYVEDGVAWLSSSIGDEPIALVELPGAEQRFDAVGYTAVVVFEEAGLVIDNVAISEGYPAGLTYPSTPPSVPDDAEPTEFRHDGLSFEFPDDWEYFTEALPFSQLPETWGFAVSPDGVSTVISVLSFTEESFAEIGATFAAFETEFIPEYLEALGESQGVTLRSDPSSTEVGGHDATLLQFEGVIGDRTGQELVTDQVWVLTESGGYLVFFRVPAEDEDVFRPVWERALASLELPNQ